jgi:AraC-like DNA-binding protein
VSIKDILIYFYLPVILFTVLCFCVIIVGIIYWIKKYKELLIILFYFLIHAGMTAMYIYPFNVFAFSLQYAFFLFCLLMFCFSAVFMVLPDASNNSDSSYRAVQYFLGKSILVYASIVFLAPKEQLIISTVDCMVSLVFISVKPKPATSCVQPFAEKEKFIFIIMITIVFLWISIAKIFLFHVLILGMTILVIVNVVLVCVIALKVYVYKDMDFIAIQQENYCGMYEKHFKIVQIIKEHINKYYTHPIDKYTIALQCEMNPDYLCKIFKSNEGITINEYIKNIRLKKALETLSNTDRKIIEIALDVGYANLATFYRHFTQFYKISPNQIRIKKSNNITTV